MLLNELLTELRGFRAHVDDFLDGIDTRYEAMDLRIDQLEDDMNVIRRCFDPPADP